MDLMGLKSAILEELLKDLEDHDGQSLKPKESVSVMAMKPEESEGEEPSLVSGGDKGQDDDDEDEMLRKLFESRMSGEQ